MGADANFYFVRFYVLIFLLAGLFFKNWQIFFSKLLVCLRARAKYNKENRVKTNCDDITATIFIVIIRVRAGGGAH